MTLKQGKDETLRNVLQCFNSEVMEVRDLKTSLVVVALMNGLRSSRFSFSLAK